MPTVTDQAICIRHWDWSETSQTVSVFARGEGLLKAIAKGSKREHSRFSGGLEVLTRAEMIAIVKPASDMANLIAWDLQETFPSLRRTLAAFYSGMYMADLVQSAVTVHDPHPALFDALLESLRMLEDGGRAGVLWFQWSVLVEAGYRPELAQDIRLGSALPPARAYTFYPRLGGFAAGEPGSSGPAWRVRAETLDGLRVMAQGGAGALPGLSPQAIDRTTRLLALYLREVLGRDMPSMGPLFGEIIT